ncbi:MAG: ATP-dependent DNA helicase [Acetatifactor sp.]|nr:ATP-dependent DNA helicase [Acetatifactor sp.]
MAKVHDTRKVNISVRGFVEFLLRSGDIDNRHQSAVATAMQEGSRIHRKIQSRMGAEYEAEVPLSFEYDTGKYTLTIEGRADGIITEKTGVIIDEIKGTYRDLKKIKEPVPVHLAQAKCYAYIHGFNEGLSDISVRMTYCNLETEEIRYFNNDYSMEELEKWFMDLVKEYLKWADYSFEWRIKRQESIHATDFPFEYRSGQKELVTHVYNTIFHGKKLFLEAPTGVGKTISTVFPAVKAMGEDLADRLFYFTAKTITRTVAENTFSLMRGNGLHFKSVVLTAKDKVCILEKPDCNPDSCPYAKGHFDRINDALYDIITNEENLSREVIDRYAAKHEVCPFEFALDISLFCDGIIGDYNYLFAPHVYLKRFFAEGNEGRYLFLVDEAHNLLDRGREMYSATLVKEKFLELKKTLNEIIMSEAAESKEKSGIEGQLSLADMTEMSENSENPDALKPTRSKGIKRGKKGGKSILVKAGYANRMISLLEKCNSEMLRMKRESNNFCVCDSIDTLVKPVTRLYSVIDDYLNENEEEKVEGRDEILDFFFEISHFLEMYELLDEHYIKYCQINEDSTFMVKLFCVDPSLNLKACMDKGVSTVLFSATFLPIQYYKGLLGGTNEDYEVYAHSVFDPGKRGVFVAKDVTSKFSMRTRDQFERIAEHIHEITMAKAGNYMVFCPSYSFMGNVYESYVDLFGEDEAELLIQSEYMNEEEREDFLARFKTGEVPDFGSFINFDVEVEEEDQKTTLIAFCVLGGIFSEGIDLKKDSLIGSIIIGTGLPLVCNERELIKRYFDRERNVGFDYAYRFPGMNKVLQAAGRVIRTAEDVGVVVLLDDRFTQSSYRKMFPEEWQNVHVADLKNMGGKIRDFWGENC